MAQPTKHLYQGFVYVPAAQTDIRKTFAKFNRDQAVARGEVYGQPKNVPTKVRKIK